MNAETAERIVRLRLAVGYERGEFQVWCLERTATAVRSGLEIGTPIQIGCTQDASSYGKFAVVVLSLPPIWNE